MFLSVRVEESTHPDVSAGDLVSVEDYGGDALNQPDDVRFPRHDMTFLVRDGDLLPGLRKLELGKAPHDVVLAAAGLTNGLYVADGRTAAYLSDLDTGPTQEIGRDRTTDELYARAAALLVD